MPQCHPVALGHAFARALQTSIEIAAVNVASFLHEIETGDIVWRPLNSPGINTLRIGLLVPSNRELTPPAEQFSRRLVDDLHRFAAV